MKRLVCRCFSVIAAVLLFTQLAIAVRVAQRPFEEAPELMNGEASRAWFYDPNPTPSDEPISTTTVNDCLWCQIVRVYHIGFPVEDSKQIGAIEANAAPFLIDGVDIGNTFTACFNEFIDEVQLCDPTLKPDKLQSVFDSLGSVVLEPADAWSR